MAIKKFLLFTTRSEKERKMFVASFDSREAAVDTAKKLKGDTALKWQVIDSATAQCVAENTGGGAAAASAAPPP